MRILSRAIFKEIAASAGLGTGLFIFVLFLRKIEQLSALLVKSSAPVLVVAKLLMYALPATLPFALPLGVLVGILIGLSRMSADSEITAIRAAGISSTSIARPVMLFAFLALVATALAALWLTPLSLNLETKTAKNFVAAQLTGNIESRIFDEQFPDTVLYVGDVQTEEKQIIWRGVFIADVTPPEKLQQEGKNREGPRIITAKEAIPYPDPTNNRIILDMHDFRSTERDKEGKAITTYAQRHQWVLQAQKQEDLQVNKTVQEMDTGPLYKYVYWRHDLSKQDYVDATIEFHQRFALPLACMLLALVGIPLGVTSRKGGKSSAYVVTVLVAFLYYMSYISLLGLAKKGSLAVPVAAWTPGAVYAILGTILLMRLELPGDRDWGAWLRAAGVRLWKWILNLLQTSTETVSRRPLAMRGFALRPMLIDGYVLSGFLFYFAILLVVLVALIEVFTFFELLGDMIKNDISMSTMLDYLWHLAPSLIYQLTPIGTLAASLICFTILTRYNEVTAFKAAGVSVHRLAAPVMFASLIISLLLFGFDHFYIPAANRRQEMLRAEIKKKPVATYRRPDRQWVYGQGSRIYNFLHLDPKQNLMSKVNVFDIDPKTSHIARQITADRAQWNDRIHKWVFENGVSQETTKEADYKQFYNATATFPELTETPSWFVKEEKEYKELNFEELGSYIDELQASGLDTTPLRVQWHKKFAVPLFALIMAILSIPFAFVGGTRGAMRGVLTAFIIAIVYWTVGTVFEQFGDLNQLPASMAAWSPDLIFFLGGLYFMLRMKT